MIITRKSLGRQTRRKGRMGRRTQLCGLAREFRAGGWEGRSGTDHGTPKTRRSPDVIPLAVDRGTR